MHSTGSDNSYQNGPVERYHRTLANSIGYMLTGANLDIKYWPYAFYHAILLSNDFPEHNSITSPIEKATSKREVLSSLQNFGYHVFVRPPGKRKNKLKNHVSKGIFHVYDPHATKNVL